MKLTNTAIRHAKPKPKPYKLTDGAGLYLLVQPNGSRYWRLDYRFAGRRRTLALGVFDTSPGVTLADARRKCHEARELLAQGIDPGETRREAKFAQQTAIENSFEAVALEWHSKQRVRWTASHAEKVLHSLKVDIFPHLGREPIDAIDAPDLLRVLRRVEHRGAHETRAKLMQRCGMIFRYGIATGRCLRNPAADLKGAFTTPKKRNHAALTAADLPEFLRKLEAFDGNIQTRLGLRLLILTFVRTTELRAAAWNEFELERDDPLWRIPAERMKMGTEHLVPLSDQAIEVLNELQTINGNGSLVFPSRSKLEQPMSKNTMLFALYRMGYHSQATVHGFRATASTILNEQGWHADVIERQLAHSERNKVRAAYNHAEYLPERRKMMQAWADYLDELRSGADVLPFRRRQDTTA